MRLGLALRAAGRRRGVIGNADGRDTGECAAGSVYRTKAGLHRVHAPVALREHACLERIAIILFACCTEAAVVPICSRSTRRCDKSQERRTRTSRLPRRACCNSCPRDSWAREHAARACRARASLCPSRRSASSALLPWTLRPFPAPAGHVSLERGCPQKRAASGLSWTAHRPLARVRWLVYLVESAI